MIVLRKGCLPIEKKEVNVDIKTRMHHNNNSGYSAALGIKRYKLICTKKICSCVVQHREYSQYCTITLNGVKL